MTAQPEKREQTGKTPSFFAPQPKLNKREKFTAL
jgi:hypothetical protein